MKRAGLWLLAALLSAAGLPAVAQQALRKPQIGYVYPAGGRQGTAVEVTVGGQYLGAARAAYVSGGGIQATFLSYKRPLTQGEVNRIRERLEEARKKLNPNAQGPLRPRDFLMLRDLAREAGVTEEQLRALEEFRRRRTDPKRQPNPQIEEEVRLRLEIAPTAEPGFRELRLVTPQGLTNPIRFVVGSLPELHEIEPNDRLPDTSIGDALPVVMNGQIMPGDVDRFTFQARAGTNLTAMVQARALTPYLADAVPGWFQAVLELYDAAGNEVAYEDDFVFDPDPILRFRVPADGTYTLVIRDAIYRGREDFVYRITLGEAPVLTSVFPAGIRLGRKSTASLRGWNLPAATLSLEGTAPGIQDVAVSASGMTSNTLRCWIADLPDMLEKEPNNDAARAQAVTLPVMVNGRIDRPGDADLFRIRGRKGQTVVCEVLARRLGSPVDAFLSLLDASGRTIASNDDFTDRAAGLVTHHADALLRATLPRDGEYLVRLEDAQGKGGPDYVYVLRISAPMPDFVLFVTPSSVHAQAGSPVPITAHVVRRDGFEGPVDLTVQGEEGFRLSGARIPAGADSVTLTMACPAPGTSEPRALTLLGTAVINGKTVTRRAIAAEERMQAFAYTHLVPAQEWLVRVQGRAVWTRPRVFDPAEPLLIPVGGTASMRLPLPAGPVARQMTVQLVDPPPGITLETVDMPGSTLVFRADPTAKKGMCGNLILQVLLSRPAAQGRPQAAPNALPAGHLPAIPFEVVAQSTGPRARQPDESGPARR